MNEISRRVVVKGLTAGVPLAAILADPVLAAAAAATTTTVNITTAGGRKVMGALALPKKTPAPAVLLIHEWWGLNDQIKTMAVEFSRQGYVALALDMYGGKVAPAGNRDEAMALMKATDMATGVDIATSWVAWLRKSKRVKEKVATCGWCFGGMWSLNTSIATPVDATVIYYGRVNRTADDLKNLKGPVLGHFGLQDQSINKPMVDGFEAEMKKAGKTFTNHWYDADHAFANPTGARYEGGAAKLAWKRTTEFLKKELA